MPEFSHEGAVSACTGATWDFARVEEFWSRYSPLTPYGKDAKDERRVFADRVRIESLYDETDSALALLDRGDGPSLDRVSYHLRRLPRLPLANLAEVHDDRDDESHRLEIVELFQIKKFISNYRAILALLDESTKRAFRLDFASTDLATRLDLGGSDSETFFIADDYHPELPEIRRRIAAVDESIGLDRGLALDESRRQYHLDFGGREFIVLRNEDARALLAACAEPSTVSSVAFIVEAYDGQSCIVRLQDGEKILLLEQERALLAAREREAEEEVLVFLSAAVAAESRILGGYVDAICAFDLALARARLAREFVLVRPDLGSDSLRVVEGRFLPCVWDCAKLDLRYTPLNLDLAQRAAVIFGSNMGGKTVALQSLVFFQIIAQSGFFVPASSFASSVHSRIVYVGEMANPRLREWHGFGEDRNGRDDNRGLSGFGFEIRSFAEAVSPTGPASQDAFIVFDEFARTTSSREAEAILSAAIEILARAGQGRSLFSTHFHGIQRAIGARFLRMRGLDRESADRAIRADEPLAERIRKINGMMRYEIVEDSNEAAEGSDAIAIAALLGLDRGIVERATSIYAAGSDSSRSAKGE
jgi:DNA mismatch repair ATPase MutS